MASPMAGHDPNGRFAKGNKVGRKFQEGHKLSVGNGGGRPSNQFRDAVKEFVDTEGKGVLLDVARDPNHKFWAHAWGVLAKFYPQEVAGTLQEGLTLPQWGAVENVS